MILNNIPIFRAMARNYKSGGMNRSLIGYTIKNDFGPFTQKEIDEYADATCDDLGKYAAGSMLSPPFFFSKELYPMFRSIITHRELGMNLIKMVHGQQGLNNFGSIHKDDRFRVEMTIADILDTPAGEMLKVLTKGFRDGSPVFEADTGFVVRRRKEIRAEESGPGTEQEAVQVYDNDDLKIIIRTYAGQERKYARVSNDTNPIHTSRFFARMAGLPGTILHGVCLMAMCTNSVIDTIASRDPSRLRSVSGRFSYPVIPGDTLTLIGRRQRRGDLSEVKFNVFSSRGKAVLRRGNMILA